MTWTPARVHEASALVSRVLHNRGLRANIENAQTVGDLMGVIYSLDCESDVVALLQIALRRKLEITSGECIDKLADLGVVNDGWPEQ